MKQRTLGRCGISVSEIGVGAWQLGGPLILDGKTDGHPDLGKGYVIDLIRQAGDLGINFIDTAEQYGAGESERRVGEALKGQRDRWVISSKFGAQVGDVEVDPATGVPAGRRSNDVSAARVPVSLEGSLRRLQTDCIDVYLYHSPPDRREAEAVARFLESAKQKGQVRAVGISTESLADCEYLLSLGCLDVVQFPQSILKPQQALCGLLAAHQVGGVVRGAFAAGRLSGKYFHQAPAIPRDDIRSGWFKADVVADEFARYRVFEELVTPQRNMPQLALRYLLDLPTTHTIILGSKDVPSYLQAIKATELPPLTEAERARLAELRAAIDAPAS